MGISHWERSAICVQPKRFEIILAGCRFSERRQLLEAGADYRIIADIVGQKSVSMVRLCSENAALTAHAGPLVRY